MAPRPRRGDVTAAAAALLATWRDELNARFARAAGDVAPGAVLAYMARTVVPILDAWHGEPPAPVLLALFDLGLTGLRAGLLVEADPSRFEQVLRARMPALGPHVAREPGVVLRALGNGYLNLVRARGPEVAAAWLEALAAGAARCADRAALLDLGVVLGWRAGLAEARDAALERVGGLEPTLVAALFGAAALDPDPARRFCQPGAAGRLGPLALIATVGGFVGFGGPFRRPPRPRVVADRLVCTDGDATLEVCADVFGARLCPAGWAHVEAQTSTDVGGAAVDAAGAVRALGVKVTLAEARGAGAAAACAGVVAVTLVDSHQVLVLGRREIGA
ncbi:MAG: hypothetical protein IPL61_12900 [Myxococcales bacterium]|nr:hypothetical protein [Myxococcales bacterium]